MPVWNECTASAVCSRDRRPRKRWPPGTTGTLAWLAGRGNYEQPCWQQAAGRTLFEPLPADTPYFDRTEQMQMLKFSVRSQIVVAQEPSHE